MLKQSFTQVAQVHQQTHFTTLNYTTIKGKYEKEKQRKKKASVKNKDFTYP